LVHREACTVASLKKNLLEKPKKFDYMKYKLDHEADIYDDNIRSDAQKDVSKFLSCWR
jgi:hypothetical protein